MGKSIFKFYAGLNSYQRFLRTFKVLENGCWEWQASKNIKGYGRIHVNGVNKTASRYSYEIYIGEIPEKMQVCHKCDNPSCVSPFHLFLGTNQDNVSDCIQKGRKQLRGKHPSFGSYYNDRCRCDKCVRFLRDYNALKRDKITEDFFWGKYQKIYNK